MIAKRYLSARHISARRSIVLALFLLSFGVSAARAVIRLAAPFGDHMVLPQGKPVVIWGSGCPGGDTVKVYIAGQTANAKSDWQGNWKVTLAPMKAGGPYQLLIQIGGAGAFVPSAAANDKGGAELNDILIGEVIQAPPAAGLEPVRVRRPPADLKPGADGKPPLDPNNLPDLPKEAPPGLVSTHPYAMVRVYRAGQDGGPPHWMFISQDTLPREETVLFNLGRDAYAKQNIPIGIIDTSAGPVCMDPAGCPVVGTPH